MTNDISMPKASLASSQAVKPPPIQESKKFDALPNLNSVGTAFNGLATGKHIAAMGATDTSLDKQRSQFPANKATAENELTEKNDEQERLRNLRDAIDKLNNQAAKTARSLNFSIDEKLNRQIITVSNKVTGEVVRQIPTEVVLKVAHSIEDIKGLLLDEEI